MKPLENKNDKTTHNNDKRSFILFKRSKLVIKCLLSITRSAIKSLRNAPKNPDPVSPVRQPVYSCSSRPAPLSIISTSKATGSVALPDQNRNIYALNPELS